MLSVASILSGLSRGGVLAWRDISGH
jgi:hypothetical protein